MSALRLFDKFQKLLDVTWPSIADGQTLKRSGSNIIGYTPGGGSGDVVGPASSVDGEVALYNSTTGKIIKRATGTGYVTVVGGVYQTPVSVDLAGRMPRGHLWGLTLANNVTDAVNDINIAVGEARDSTNVVDMVLAGAITKRLDAAWAVGTNQGGLDTGSIADVTYHVHLIKRVDTGVVDVLFSASPTAPTLPANYTRFRRIGSIVRSAGTIAAFYQYGDKFLYAAQVLSVDTTGNFTRALFAFPVPTGIIVFPILFEYLYQSAAGSSTFTVYPGGWPTSGGIALEVRATDQAARLVVSDLPTNTNAQLYFESVIVGSLGAGKIFTVGWDDLRDRI